MPETLPGHGKAMYAARSIKCDEFARVAAMRPLICGPDYEDSLLGLKTL